MSQFYHDIYDVMNFEEAVMTDDWDEVVSKYEIDEYYHKLKIKGSGTALHVAANNGEIDIVKQLLNAIVMHSGQNSAVTLEKLSVLNEIGGSPLHLAAYRGFTSICKCIIGKNGERKDLINVKNENYGETPIIWAVFSSRIEVFVYLNQYFYGDVNTLINKNETTILHIAIHREMFGLADMIMHCYPTLSSIKDKKEVPLEVLATKTSAFMSGSQLSWWKFILYHCFPVEIKDAETKLKTILKSIEKEKDGQSDGDYIWMQLDDDGEYETEGKIQKALAQLDFISSAKILRYRIQKYIMSLLGLNEIKHIRKNHLYGRRLLENFLGKEKAYESYKGGGNDALVDTEHEEEIKNFKFDRVTRDLPNTTGDTSTKEIEKEENQIDEKDKTLFEAAKSGIVEIMNSKVLITPDKRGLLLVALKNIETISSSEETIDTKERTYLIATKHGIVEIMCALESKMKSVIYELNYNDENALLLAVKYRQPNVIEKLEKRLDKKIFHVLCLKVDNNENTMLHLAAYTSLHKETTWRTSGDAMQMMWDIKWYKYIKGIVPDHFQYRCNNDKKTPGEIFKEEHKDLLEKSSNWLKETAESCSVVAALIAGLSFATSGSVPGGNKDTGKPALEGQPAFEGFAISSLIGLYFSGTALIMFLSILTSRKQIEDFNKNLPKKLLFGLSCLFISIVAMFISFCAGHFFVLTDKYGKHDILFYLYIVFSIPVIYYAVVQLPLYYDLLKVIWKKVPPPSVKGVHL